MPASVERCVKHLIADGKSKDSAWAICQSNHKKAMKKGDLFEDGEKLFLKTFLINNDVNKIGWGVDPLTLDRNIMSFIDKPLVVMEDFTHPNEDNIDDSYEHATAFQENYRIGNIKNVVKEDGDYKAIIEITDEEAKSALRSGDLPTFVSPQIYHPTANIEGAIATNWEGTHIALVVNPAWGPHRARITNQCSGDSDTCLSQLMKSGSCDFCIKRTIQNYKYIVSKNKSGSDSSNINKNRSRGSLADNVEGSNETSKTVSIEDFNKLKEQLEQEQAKAKILEDTNISLKSTNDSNADKVKALEQEFRIDKISEILADAQYPNDEARTNAINSFTKSGMGYDEIKGHVAHLKTKSGSFNSKLPTQESEDKKTKSGSGDNEDNTDNFAAAYTIYQYGVGVVK